MHTTQPKNLVDAVTSSPTTAPETEIVFTLSDGHQDTHLDRPIMWHGPNPIGLGGRSPVPKAGVQAWGVTDGVQTPSDAALAGIPDVHLAQTGVLWPKSAEALRLMNGDVKEANPYQTTNTNTIMDWSAWRQGVMHVSRHHANSMTALDNAASALTEVESFEIVNLGRVVDRLNDSNRKARKDTLASKGTLADYAKKCNQIDREMAELDDDEPEPLWQVMGRHAAKRQSFTAIKSALKSREIKRIQDLLSSQDALQKTEKKGTAWKKHVLHLLAAMQDFIEVDVLDRGECLEFSGHKARAGRSKRSDLPHLPQGWQDRFLDINALGSTYRDAGVLLRYCGLRPTELAKGVKVSATLDGISVHILGGKTRETAGQPWRSFLLDSDLLPMSFVHRVQMEGEITVTADPDALRAYLHRQSDRVFQQGSFKPKGVWKKSFVLSAYTFRHAFVTDLREAGWDTDSIAAVIGESSAQTVSYYGTRSRAGIRTPKKSGVMKNSVQAARPVRPLNKAGLSQVLALKAISVKKKSNLHPRPGP